MSLAFAVDAEGERIVEELPALVRDSKWLAVERAYVKLLERHPSVITSQVHRMGAIAARAEGDLLVAAQRLQRVRAGTEGHPEAVGDLKVLGDTTGLVRVEAGGRALAPEALPFAPDLRKATELAVARTSQDGYWIGLLPAGTYTVGERTFEVVPGLTELQVVRP